MRFSALLRHARRPRAVAGLATLVAVACCGILLAVPALGHEPGAPSGSPAPSVSDTLGMASLPVHPAKISCSTLAETEQVDGLSVKIDATEVGSASAGSPQYCAVTGHIAANIGFEALFPVSTWRGRYLQIGCGGLCGNIGLNAPQSTDYQPLQNGWFVVASQDEGHAGNGTTWSTNGPQRVDFAYLSDHDLAVVVKGLANAYYGYRPIYSYFDGCSQGGHQALTEAQRFPKDFNGILAGAPASIMTELNAVLHEYTYAQNYDHSSGTGDYSGNTILGQTDANNVLNAAMKACYPQVGLMLDYRACEQKFNLDSIRCSPTLTSNCLTPAQIAVVQKIWAGPVDPQGQHLYPGGYPLGSEFNWSNGTSANLPMTAGGTATPAGFITAWLQYFTFGTPQSGVTLSANDVADEPFTKAEFDQIEKLAPFWDATNPDLSSFERVGGKLILWQGEADWSIPTISSIAYYQAVVKAMGGLWNTQQFARYYLLPSVGHCGGNGPDTYPGLASVVSWAETGHAPSAMTANQYAAPTTPPAPSTPVVTSTTGTPTGDETLSIPALGAANAGSLTRAIRIFPYPELPAYNGYGNVDDPASFYGQVSTALQQPTPWLGSFNSEVTWCDSSGVNCRTVNEGHWPVWGWDGHSSRVKQ
ncbi:MAG TPA: tannase/feruloyl esterase family alpha/beta hydrolase [Solirubrobacteraceae bacterium]|nr:tannase/feruloyl esterase family alpha/beta hydrolase [Solirubrobacteraceae bacterium]